MNTRIKQLHDELGRHPVFRKVDNLDAMKIFMKYHIFAVWDFMSLLKSLQRNVTCVALPWKESTYNPELVRLINEIVIGEESDLGPDGRATSHFSLYREAMNEVGADTGPIDRYLIDFNSNLLPKKLSKLVTYHLDLAMNGSVHAIAAAFFYGRENIIPLMFESLVRVIEGSDLSCPKLLFYLRRHIEVDGNEHGPAALKFLDELVGNSDLRLEAEKTALESLRYRKDLWDFIAQEIELQGLSTELSSQSVRGASLCATN